MPSLTPIHYTHTPLSPHTHTLCWAQISSVLNLSLIERHKPAADRFEFPQWQPQTSPSTAVAEAGCCDWPLCGTEPSDGFPTEDMKTGRSAAWPHFTSESLIAPVLNTIALKSQLTDWLSMCVYSSSQGYKVCRSHHSSACSTSKKTPKVIQILVPESS